jgi:hypothetical protein
MASRADQIIDRFTTDPVVKKDVLAVIADVKSGKHPHDLDATIARFTTDPVLTAKIKGIVQGILSGKSHHEIAKTHHGDTPKAAAAAAKMTEHRDAVSRIVSQK